MTALSIALLSPAQAEYVRSGNNWLRPCQERNPQCGAYITGVLNGFMEARPATWCAPRDVTVGQVVRLVVRRMEQKPEELHEPFAAIVIAAVADGFPCER